MAEIYSNFEFQDAEFLVLQNGLNNPLYTNVLPKLDKSFFTTPARVVLFNIMQNYIIEYDTNPSFTVVTREVSNLGLDEHLIKSIATDLIKMKSGFEENIVWLLKETETWGQYRSATIGLNKARDLLDNTDEQSISTISAIVESSLSFTLESRTGHSYFDDIEVQYEFYNNPIYRFQCDLEEINDITQGGITSKTLNMFFAGINVGKTMFLINMARSFMLRGYNVLYISAEADEMLIRERVDVSLFGIPSSGLRKLTLDEYREKVNDVKSKTNGQMFIKNYAPGAKSSTDIKQLMIEYKLQHDIRIDLVCVDYLGIIKSSRLPVSAMSNSNLYGKAVAEELRALASDMDVPIWSAGQLNRDAQDGTESAGMKNIADSIGIMATCDFAIIGTQPKVLESEGLMKINTIKNRYGDRTAITDFVVGSNNRLQLFYSTSDGKKYTQAETTAALAEMSKDQDAISLNQLDNVKLPVSKPDVYTPIPDAKWTSDDEDEDISYDTELLKSLMASD